MAFSIYIHYPFCVKKCWYCDFFSIPVDQFHLRGVGSFTSEVKLGYPSKIIEELEKRGGDYSPPVTSIYFGGGTPSLMTPDDVGKILDAIMGRFAVVPSIEITLEANPGTVDQAKLNQFHLRGVNRLSIGVQSFQDPLLKYLGRIHTASEARSAVEMAIDAGFKNIGIDLMHGIPGETVEMCGDDLEEAVKLGVQHISNYCLTVENGGQFPPLTLTLSPQGRGEGEGDEQAAEYEAIHKYLTTRGYDHYEISNFARPGFESRHNLNYWNHGDYLGLGAGATSFIKADRGLRTMDHGLRKKGQWSMVNGPLSYEIEEITPQIANREAIFLGLRTKNGILKAKIADLPPKIIKNYEKRGLLEQNDTHIRLTPKGWLFADEIASLLI